MGGGLCAILTVQSRWYDQDVTIVKNPGEPTMEVIVKSGQEIKTLNMSETMVEEDVVGTIYEMKGGGIRRLLPTLRRPYRTITCADASSYRLSRKPRSFSRSMNLVITIMIMQITTINCCDAGHGYNDPSAAKSPSILRKLYI